MSKKPVLVAMDLEGCLIPEIWINVAVQIGITGLKLTTRDVQDYDELMQKRLSILRQENVKLSEIQAVIAQLEPLQGAREFLDWMRSKVPVIILSDTYYEFASPLMVKLSYPTLFCHTLEVAKDQSILNYCIRSRDSKKTAVEGFQKNGFYVVAIGDSYNDVQMLKAADRGILFHAPDNIQKQFSQFTALTNYQSLKTELSFFLCDG